MTKAELEPLRRKLLVMRSRLTGEVLHLTDEAFPDTEGAANTQPIHMADLGSDAYEQEITISMLQSEESLLAEIDAALERIENGTYGVCEMSGKPIPKSRLQAIPWTRFRVECARQAEGESES